MRRFIWPILLTGLLLGCSSLKGPNQSYVAPAVVGRVVEASSGQPVAGARVERHLSPPTNQDPLAEKGAQRLLLTPSARADDQGEFAIPPLKGAYLLVRRPGVYEFTLVVRQAQYQTLTTNIDLLKLKPVMTNDVLTVFVGDLPLQASQE